MLCFLALCLLLSLDGRVFTGLQRRGHGFTCCLEHFAWRVHGSTYLYTCLCLGSPYDCGGLN